MFFLSEGNMNDRNDVRDTASRARSIADAIFRRQQEKSDVAPLIVAISGIDASGKSTLARRAAADLNTRGVGTVVISVDDWHNPPEKRFSTANPAGHFYQNAFRFGELFRILIHPLRRLRELQITIGLTRMPQGHPVRQTYDFRGVKVVILEGIFLLKQELLGNYDLTFWLDCSFQTALARSLQRNQEGLSGSEIVRDYQTIYFAAQKLHFTNDAPRERTDFIIANDAAISRTAAPPRAEQTMSSSASRPAISVSPRVANVGVRARELSRFDAWRFAGPTPELECT